MKIWRALRNCIQDGKLVYRDEVIEAEEQPSEHFEQVGVVAVQADFNQVDDKKPGGQRDDTIAQELKKISKEQLVAFAAKQELAVDPSGTKAEIFDAIAAGIIAKDAAITKDAVMDELQSFVRPNE